MKILTKHGEYIFISIFILLTVILSISQTILYAIKTPPGHTFLFIHNFVEDYYYYLHLMRQGWEGGWLATSWLTPEVYPGAMVNIFFLLLGHLARVFHIGIPIMYLSARISGGAVLLILVYVLIQKIFTKDRTKRLVAFLFVLFGGFWWGWGSSGPVVAPLVHQWTELDPIFRWSYIPHHLWSKVGMVTLIILLIKPKKSAIYLFFMSVLTVLTGFINPVIYATLLPLICLWAGLELVRDTEQRKNIWFYLPWICIVISALAVGLYHRQLSATLFPWTSYALWEKTLTYSVSMVEYAKALGPNFILFLLAIPVLWRFGKQGTLLIAWAFSSWIMLFGLRNFIPVTVERFLGGYQFIPLSIGAAEGLWILIRKIISILRMHVHGKYTNYLRADFWFGGFACMLLVYFIFGLSAVLGEHVGYVEKNRTDVQVYVPNELMNALAFVEKNTPRQSVILAPYYISTMIPAITGNRVIGGHALMTQDAGEKQQAIADFFAGKNVSPSDLLEKYNVFSILAPSTMHLPYKIVFRSGEFTVYNTKEKQ